MERLSLNSLPLFTGNPPLLANTSVGTPSLPKSENLTYKITSILLANGYPDDVIKSAITKKLKQFQEPITSGSEKCPVHLRLQWLGSISTKFEKQVKAAVSNCFFAVEPRIIFKTKELVPVTKKDVLPAHQQSNVIYEYSCHCDSRCVGRTSQRLLDRINQHIPKSIRNANSILKRSLPSRACKSSTPNPTQTSSSSFGGASLPRQMEGPRPRVYPFTTLATKLLGSDADCKGLQPASCFVIQNH